MAKTRDNYQVTGRTVDEITRNLNFILQRFADRMDKIEGIRGTASIESDLDMNLNRIREVAAGDEDTDAARAGDLLLEPLRISSLDVTGDVSVGGDIEVMDADSHTIHSME